MRIKPDLKKTMIMFIFLSLLMLVLFYLAAGSYSWPPKIVDYIVIGAWLILTGSFLFITVKFGYYTLAKKELVQRRFTKELFYRYEDVVYIDESYSRKNKTLRFVMKNGDIRYLVSDKGLVLIDEMLKRCPNLQSAEDFKFNYPNVKL